MLLYFVIWETSLVWRGRILFAGHEVKIGSTTKKNICFGWFNWHKNQWRGRDDVNQIQQKTPHIVHLSIIMYHLLYTFAEYDIPGLNRTWCLYMAQRMEWYSGIPSGLSFHFYPCSLNSQLLISTHNYSTIPTDTHRCRNLNISKYNWQFPVKFLKITFNSRHGWFQSPSNSEVKDSLSQAVTHAVPRDVAQATTRHGHTEDWWKAALKNGLATSGNFIFNDEGHKIQKSFSFKFPKRTVVPAPKKIHLVKDFTSSHPACSSVPCSIPKIHLALPWHGRPPPLQPLFPQTRFSKRRFKLAP